MPEPMPALFFGHGNPMNALAKNGYTESWAALGRDLPRPKAILAVSAHWFGPGTAVTAMENPRTIHDFGGFPPELFAFSYPAPGDPGLAREVQALLGPTRVALSSEWGLDHGTWSVLAHAYPQADIPVIQLSIDEEQSPEFHYHLGARLGSLRDEGVLIVGSGNIVHNLHAYAWGRHQVDAFDWAVRFEDRVRSCLIARDDEPLIAYETSGRDAMLSVPTPDHYLPLLYIAALRRPDEPLSFPTEGFDGGSISMLSLRIG
ncbi:MAG: 4,5-DOPA dioxygenase extradiol [Candidatus Baltobacteraceae bacterium]